MVHAPVEGPPLPRLGRPQGRVTRVDEGPHVPVGRTPHRRPDHVAPDVLRGRVVQGPLVSGVGPVSTHGTRCTRRGWRLGVPSGPIEQNLEGLFMPRVVTLLGLTKPPCLPTPDSSSRPGSSPVGSYNSWGSLPESLGMVCVKSHKYSLCGGFGSFIQISFTWDKGVEVNYFSTMFDGDGVITSIIIHCK